ncbi:hypothetical protein MO867_21165 [Microbulbifer sp. OS29]|uniref:Uncharacterized protein n=1 Tax=Microbulbifer okhotskensis TaxID=2926617 RepID=A0A9X2ER47_9GAMM|nr:hypothetical protein [Microbulbifer okhotskensis]MCO1336842.1 hypothetical protein [Microbulbifer okhotskensis]
MSFGKYFRIALFFPYLIGGIAAALAFTTGFGVKNELVFFTVFSIVFAGIPYALFVALAFAWSKSRSDSEIKKAMWLAPLLFLPLLIIVPFVSGSPGGFLQTIASIAILWGFALVYGYGYVLLTYGGWVLIKKMGLGCEQT